MDTTGERLDSTKRVRVGNRVSKENFNEKKGKKEFAGLEKKEFESKKKESNPPKKYLEFDSNTENYHRRDTFHQSICGRRWRWW